MTKARMDAALQLKANLNSRMHRIVFGKGDTVDVDAVLLAADAAEQLSAALLWFGVDLLREQAGKPPLTMEERAADLPSTSTGGISLSDSITKLHVERKRLLNKQRTTGLGDSEQLQLAMVGDEIDRLETMEYEQQSMRRNASASGSLST